jgi:hypothetical protein
MAIPMAIGFGVQQFTFSDISFYVVLLIYNSLTSVTSLCYWAA